MASKVPHSRRSQPNLTRGVANANVSHGPRTVATPDKPILSDSRVRDKKKHVGVAELKTPNHPVNPYPWLGQGEAFILELLQERNLPFAHRWFPNLAATAPLTAQLIPDFAPEFVLPAYKTVIMVLGNYYGTLPGILDRNALAQALLTQDGWTSDFLLQQDIERDPAAALDSKFPNLPKNAGGPFASNQLANPYGEPHFLIHTRQGIVRHFKVNPNIHQRSVKEGTRSGLRTFDGRRRHGSEFDSRIRTTERAFQSKRGSFRSR